MSWIPDIFNCNRARYVNMKNLKLFVVPFLSFSLSACGGSSSSGPSATSSTPAKASLAAHDIKISPEEAKGPGVKGTGHLKSVERTLEQFHAIEIVDMVDVQVIVGTTLKCTLEVDDNLADAYDTKVKDGRLIISANKDFHTYRAPAMSIGVPELSEVYAYGPGQITINGVKGDIFKIDANGSGKVFAAGKVSSLKAINGGAGLLDCSKVTADNVDVDSTGAGATRVKVEKALTVKLEGSGSVKYLGAPASLTKNIKGTGTVDPLTAL
jgi:hypothetical protein